MSEPTEVLDQFIAAFLRPGELVLGRFVAQRVAMFSSPLFALYVTQDRLILQQTAKKVFAPDGEPVILDSADIAGVHADCKKADWRSLESNERDSSTVKLAIRTSGGPKLRFGAMRGDATVLGRIGVAADQRAGLNALGEFIDRHNID